MKSQVFRSLLKASYSTTKVPVETHILPHFPVPWKVVEGHYKCELVTQHTPDILRSKAKLFMLDHFYQEAPIPRALRFHDRIKESCEKTRCL